jgi:hypothetical protein
LAAAMQNSFDFFLAYWYVLLPAALIAAWAVWTLIKMGHLESLTLYGLKLIFNQGKKEQLPHYARSLKHQDVKFTKTALRNISALGITEDKVIYLIDREFMHHANYFLLDLYYYPLPIQQNYVVILDKTGGSLLVRGIKSADFNEAQLVSVNSLLAGYRRLIRYKYRTITDYVLRPEMIKEISKSHSQMIHALIRHYIFYKEPAFQNSQMIDIYLNYEEMIEKAMDPSEAARYKRKAEASLPGNRVFAYSLINAAKALKEINNLAVDVENGFILPDVADREIILSLERSLQYIHQAINLLFID